MASGVPLLEQLDRRSLMTRTKINRRRPAASKRRRSPKNFMKRKTFAQVSAAIFELMWKTLIQISALAKFICKLVREALNITYMIQNPAISEA
ncbi:hypothetical protein BJF93_22035 [Xaviernesmea oryzae]|uniref:Uncharacterized protein n=1 Tax=Xaviernesmea oryzae TaxID=464029 RepID=A0A1Q9AW89_9HYPH|nr:hypothetical protein BJF93_22035 [Xaviernesmea oryzae]SEM40402.1 hypothetical protein SAMN04487976_1452 [Xaviernesmea oryzae]